MIGRVLVCFAFVFIVAIVAMFDLHVGTTMFRQVRALSFATTQGVVTQSDVQSERGGKGGRVHGVHIVYAYAVDGERFERSRYRYDDSDKIGGPWARNVIAAHPPGTAVTVRYDPRNPGESVLSPGVDGGDLFWLLFLTPFNLMALACITAPFSWINEHKKPRPRHGVNWLRRDRVSQVRLSLFSPVIAGALAALGVGFASIFVVGFTAGGFRPNLVVMLIDFAVILAVGIVVWLRERGAHARGDYDLVIDPGARRVALPKKYGRAAGQHMPLSEVRGVRITQEVDEPRKEKSANYTVSLERAHGGSELVADWSDPEDAEAFAAELRAAIKRANPDF